ncbi:NhaP-type Na+/H+ or K+/H+ antiporter [Cohaesibacter sp. ES.047]|uniref:cation:proton antiporter n=1 Tax=Cohaesibacter sp. ES.047 TaxID=1798205 RepID=UPI000BB6DC0E|nr:cation:proton antiporter [Cohaesibacter sp. ES.047]SNY93783.1 NhaP-type Na+/H+ or K+/H+ antiporter [Cohaesibacter sp. ES.047]
MIANVGLLAAFAFFYSLISARLSSTVLTGPMIFVLFGLLAGNWGLGLFEFNINAHSVRTFADWTLALVLFTDAATANRSALVHKIRIPERMLFIGMPLVMLLGTAVGWLLFDHLPIWEIAIVACCLAATDAALGAECLHDEAVPNYLRTGLNVESGLNDGLAVPVLLVLIELAVALPDSSMSGTDVMVILLREIGLGVVVGVAVSMVGVFLMQQAKRFNWVDADWKQIPVVALAMCSFAFAQELEGSGYIAAFCGGLMFRQLTKRFSHGMIEGATEVGETLSLVVWVFFGAVMLDIMMPVMHWTVLVYALLSLTVVRSLSIILSLAWSGETLAGKTYLGWFGPRGLASLVFVEIVSNAGVPHTDFIAGVVFTTVLMSVFLHGLSTHPMSRWLAQLDQESKRRRNGADDKQAKT